MIDRGQLPNPSPVAVNLVHAYVELSCDGTLADISHQSGVPLEEMYAAMRARFLAISEET